MTALRLPFPPSLNHYWRHARGRHYISAQGKRYREWVIIAAKEQNAVQRYTERLSVILELYPPDRRSFDVDNRAKGLLDALQYAQVYEDDSQIDRLTIIRQEPCKPGYCLVTVGPLPGG